MTDFQIDLQIGPLFAPLVSEPDLIRIARTVLDSEHQPPQTGLTLVITDDNEIQSLNSAFRGIDRPTDVLSFSDLEGDEPFVDEESSAYLGDIVISYPTAERQAARAVHAINDELGLLVIHGCLHLLGYDHGTPSEQLNMWQRQDALLARCGIEICSPGFAPDLYD